MSKIADPAEQTDATDPPVFMKTITNNELATMTIRQKGFIVSIRSLDHSVAGTALNETIAEMFPSTHLFSSEIKEIPSVWIELRKRIDTYGEALPQHSSRRIIMILANSLYGDAEDR